MSSAYLYPRLRTFDDNQIIFVRPTLRSLWPWILLTLISCVVILTLAIEVPELHNFGFISFIVLPIGLFLELLRRYYNNVYTITPNSVIQVSGRLSFSVHNWRVLHKDIRAIHVSQTLLGRLMNFGTVRLYTAATDGPELCLSGVANPMLLAQKLEYLRGELVSESRFSKNCEFKVNQTVVESFENVDLRLDCESFGLSYFREMRR